MLPEIRATTTIFVVKFGGAHPESLSLSTQLSSQKHAFLPFRTLNLTPFWIILFASQIPLHRLDAPLFSCIPFIPWMPPEYLFISTCAQSLLASVSSLHPIFARNAMFISLAFLIPRPPCSFVRVTTSYLMLWIFLSPSLLPHMKFLTFMSIASQTPLGKAVTCIV